jgi:hypothetical protein
VTVHFHPPEVGAPEMPHDEDPRRRVSQTHRFQSESASDIFQRIGIDIEDVDSVRELAADLYYLRRQRVGHQARVSMTWTTVISAVASAIVGALGVILASLLHAGKGTP